MYGTGSRERLPRSRSECCEEIRRAIDAENMPMGVDDMSTAKGDQ